MEPLKIDHISLLVSSMERSMPYYSALLPLVGFREEREGVWTDGNGFYFQFMEASPEARPYERYGAGMSHLGFSAPDAETVRTVRNKMAEAGYPVPDLQPLGGSVALFMKDPDGIRFEITYYAPAPNAVGGDPRSPA